MVSKIALYTGALFTLFWGIAHLFPTRSVVRGFGAISVDNYRIIIMEWIAEGVLLIFIGVLICAVTYVDHTHEVSIMVYWLSALFLNIMSMVSLYSID